MATRKQRGMSSKVYNSLLKAYEHYNAVDRSNSPRDSLGGFREQRYQKSRLAYPRPTSGEIDTVKHSNIVSWRNF